MTYSEFGQQHTPEQRFDAAIASLALTFGPAWFDSHSAHYLERFSNRFLEFAGEEAFVKAYEFIGIDSLGDDDVPWLVDIGKEACKQAFDWDKAPHSRNTFNELWSLARKGAKL